MLVLSIVYLPNSYNSSSTTTVLSSVTVRTTRIIAQLEYGGIRPCYCLYAKWN